MAKDDSESPTKGVVWLEREPFPYQRTRDIFDIAGECITYHASISRKHEPAETYIARAKRIDTEDKDLLREFARGAFKKMDEMPPDVLDGYTKYWQILWDVCGYDQLMATLGGGEPEPESREFAALGLYKSNSTHTRKTIDEGVALMQEGKYKECFGALLKAELVRVNAFHEQQIVDLPTTFTDGLYMAHDDSLEFLSRVKEFLS